MKKYTILFSICTMTILFQAHAIKLDFKGGTSNKINVAIFKDEKKFKNFMSGADISGAATDLIAENAPKLGNVIAPIAGLAAGSAGIVTGPGAPIIGVATSAAVKVHFNLIGRLAGLSNPFIRERLLDLHSNHSFDMNTGKSMCIGIGSLIREYNLLSDNKLMQTNNPKPIYLVVFNRHPLKDQNNEIISSDYDVIFADYLYPNKNTSGKYIASGGAFASYNITTHGVTTYLVDTNNNPILKDGKPIVAYQSLAAKLTLISPTGGISCPKK